jgi:hypothetical protein
MIFYSHRRDAENAEILNFLLFAVERTANKNTNLPAAETNYPSYKLSK